MRRHLSAFLLLLAGIVLGWASSSACKTTRSGPLGVGTPVTITRPTGEFVTDKSGEFRAPVLKRHRLTVARVGGQAGPPLGSQVWVLILGDEPDRQAIYYLVLAE